MGMNGVTIGTDAALKIIEREISRREEYFTVGESRTDKNLLQ